MYSLHEHRGEGCPFFERVLPLYLSLEDQATSPVA